MKYLKYFENNTKKFETKNFWLEYVDEKNSEEYNSFRLIKKNINGSSLGNIRFLESQINLSGLHWLGFSISDMNEIIKLMNNAELFFTTNKYNL